MRFAIQAYVKSGNGSNGPSVFRLKHGYFYIQPLSVKSPLMLTVLAQIFLCLMFIGQGHSVVRLKPVQHFLGFFFVGLYLCYLLLECKFVITIQLYDLRV